MQKSHVRVSRLPTTRLLRAPKITPIITIALLVFPIKRPARRLVTLPLTGEVALPAFDYFDSTIASYNCDHIKGITVETDHFMMMSRHSTLAICD